MVYFSDSLPSNSPNLNYPVSWISNTSLVKICLQSNRVLESIVENSPRGCNEASATIHTFIGESMEALQQAIKSPKGAPAIVAVLLKWPGRTRDIWPDLILFGGLSPLHS